MENVISKTSLITLYFKAMDAKSEKSVLNDKLSLEIMKNFDIDTSKLEKAYFSKAGTIARAKFFDDLAKDFIQKNENPIIVNMASGLDTRTLRIYDEKARFFDVDLPEVIELRKKYINDKSTLISADLLKFDNFNELLKYKNSQYCFIFEGFFIYFNKEDIRKILNNIVDNFHGEILGDFNFGDFWKKNQSKHDALKGNNANFETSFQTKEELLSINKKLTLKQEKYFYDKDFAYIFSWRRYLMMLSSKKIKNAMRLLQLKF